jgi:5-oxoprolinase (ATP-hydrolysing)
MTNTRITDPEVMELRYPVRLDRFAIRKGSGGSGLHKGGDGVIRQLTFLDRVSLTVLTQHRKAGPYGLAGGKSGLPGNQYIIRKNGEAESLEGIDGKEMNPGDSFVIGTPGGGGFGGAP